MEWFRRITWNVDLQFQDGAWFDNELIQANITGGPLKHGEDPATSSASTGGLEMNEGKISHYLGLQFDVTEAHYDAASARRSTGDTVVNTPYVRGIAESHTSSGRSIP